MGILISVSPFQMGHNKVSCQIFWWQRNRESIESQPSRAQFYKCQYLVFMLFLLDTQAGIGLGDISREKNYRKPIYRHFSNYWQNYRYPKLELGNYRQTIDIGKCIKCCPINIWKAKSSKNQFQQLLTQKIQEKLPLLPFYDEESYQFNTDFVPFFVTFLR